jgi:hypothetical protein
VTVAYWHKADVQRLPGLGPLTGALPTFGAECRPPQTENFQENFGAEKITPIRKFG